MQLQIGVDVSSKWLDIEDGQQNTFQIDNKPNAIEQWLKSVKLPASIAMESTSIYHRLLAHMAFKAGLTVYVLNPRIVHHYAKGVGRRAKTDKVDARIIRRYLIKECDSVHSWQPLTEGQALIDTLLNRRSLLVCKKQSIQMACKDIASISQEMKPALEALNAFIRELEKIIVAKLKEEKHLTVQFKLLQSIPGIGVLTSAYMTNLLDKYTFKSADQLTCYLGMDLIYFDSGQKQSRRKLSKSGASEARRLLFNCARAASQGALGPLYKSYSSRMNHTKATVAMMRKLIKLIYGVWNSKQVFSLEKYGSPLLKTS